MMSRFVLYCFCVGAAVLQTGYALQMQPHHLPRGETAAAPQNQKQIVAVAERRQECTAITASAVLDVPTQRAVGAIAQLLSTCGVGIFASKRGLLDKGALAVLSKLVFGLLQPCMLFVNVADTVSKAQGGPLTWMLPLAAALQITAGYVVGRIMNAIVYRGGHSKDVGNEEERADLMKQSLTCATFGNSGPLPFVFVDALFRGHPDPTLLPQANAYISLYLLGWSPLFWIFAPATLLGTDNDPSLTSSQRRQQLFQRLFSPPVVASLAGMVVGIVPFLRNIFVGRTALLKPVNEAMRTLGSAYLPVALLVLAGSLSKAGEIEKSSSEDTIFGQDKRFVKQITAIYAARFMLLPTFAFTIVKILRTHVPAFEKLLSDPVLLLVLLLETCMPSAQNSTVILNMRGKSQAAASMARVLMTVYIFSLPAISYWLSRILSMVPSLVA